MDQKWQSCAQCSLADVPCSPDFSTRALEVKALKEEKEVDQLLDCNDSITTLPPSNGTTPSESMQVDISQASSPQQERGSPSPPPICSLLRTIPQACVQGGLQFPKFRSLIMGPVLEQLQKQNEVLERQDKLIDRLRDASVVQEQELRKRRLHLEELSSTMKEKEEAVVKYKIKIDQLTSQLTLAKKAKEIMKSERDMLRVDVIDFQNEASEFNKTIEMQGLQIKDLLQTIEKLKEFGENLQRELKQANEDTKLHKKRCLFVERRMENQGKLLIDQGNELEQKSKRLEEIQRSKSRRQDLTNLDAEPLGRCVQLKRLTVEAEEELVQAKETVAQLKEAMKVALQEQLSSLA